MSTEVIIEDGGKTQFPIAPFNHLKIIVPSHFVIQIAITVCFINRQGKTERIEHLIGTGVIFDEPIGDYVRFYFEASLRAEFAFELTLQGKH